MLFSTLIRFWKKNSITSSHVRKGYGLTIIIPFRKSRRYSRQNENFQWVKKYWKCQLPGAQIIRGRDYILHRPFSKAASINNAAKKARGDILVISDADCYIDTDVVLFCAEEIRRARRRHQRLWFVPYRKFFRLTDEASRRVLDSDPCVPHRFPTPPLPQDEDSTGYRKHHHQHQLHRHCWSGSRRGHWYGAMIQIMPREAFEAVGGWDTRFRGWGGEDHSAMRAMDMLYWRHKTTPNQVLHLWHPMMSKSGIEPWVDWKDRLWDNQRRAGNNGRLASRYSNAFGDVKRMRALVAEGQDRFLFCA